MSVLPSLVGIATVFDAVVLAALRWMTARAVLQVLWASRRELGADVRRRRSLAAAAAFFPSHSRRWGTGSWFERFNVQ